jgi:hypothetical protein
VLDEALPFREAVLASDGELRIRERDVGRACVIFRLFTAAAREMDAAEAWAWDLLS